MTDMASAAPDSTRRKAAKDKADVLGRSPATGRLVYAPVFSKGASVTIEDVRSAVRAIQAKKA